jgi:hypothetical protein
MRADQHSSEGAVSKGKSEHHGKTVHFQESATKHHRAAELEYGSGDHKKAALDAQLGNDHGGHATRHDEVTAGEKIAHYGMQPAPVSRPGMKKTKRVRPKSA